MKKKYLLACLALCISLSACGSQNSKEVKSTTSKNTAKSEKITEACTSEKSTSKEASIKKSTVKKESSLQAELEKLETKSKEYDNVDTSYMKQGEMNDVARKRYYLWEDEINSIWKRLYPKLSASTKKKLLDEQRKWIAQKDRDTFAAGITFEGGSMQPLITYPRAEMITRKRIYELAKKLADLNGESFVISPEVQNELNKGNPTLDQVFELFKGKWVDDSNSAKYIGIARASEKSEYAPKGSSWVVWNSEGDIVSDLDYYGFSEENIIFKKKDKDGTYTYYWLSIYDDHSHAYLSHSKDKDKLYEAGNGIGGKRG
ncbi:lysozyme inhibitor LprI family protein [Lachnobacterium bovis]|uniref:lysozyme inhibitor LprI family protein n=1 Tax=Lachnobacterium bovis TaxID=140626 RepID=UPI000691373A|nr:lysozyme inhibitor LprI family protein [Lachnobacterium bovis]